MAVQNILEDIKKLTLIEVNELVKSLEEEFGVSAAAPVVAASTEASTSSEQTEFDLVLTSFGSEKIKVIKVVREITGLGLGEAKTLVESAPAKIKEAINKTDAETFGKKLTEVGATIEIK